MADVLGKKISELAETTDLAGLFTIGSDKNNQSKKVSLQFVKEAADYANAQGDYAKTVGDTVQGNTGVDEYPVFSASKQYAAGDVVLYDGRLYKFTALHAAGAWIGTDAVETSIKAEADQKLATLESKLGVGFHLSGNENGRFAYSFKANESYTIHNNASSGYVVIYLCQSTTDNGDSYGNIVFGESKVITPSSSANYIKVLVNNSNVDLSIALTESIEEKIKSIDKSIDYQSSEIEDINKNLEKSFFENLLLEEGGIDSNGGLFVSNPNRLRTSNFIYGIREFSIPSEMNIIIFAAAYYNEKTYEFSHFKSFVSSNAIVGEKGYVARIVFAHSNTNQEISIQEVKYSGALEYLRNYVLEESDEIKKGIYKSVQTLTYNGSRMPYDFIKGKKYRFTFVPNAAGWYTIYLFENAVGGEKIDGFSLSTSSPTKEITITENVHYVAIPNAVIGDSVMVELLDTIEQRIEQTEESVEKITKVANSAYLKNNPMVHFDFSKHEIKVDNEAILLFNPNETNPYNDVTNPDDYQSPSGVADKDNLFRDDFGSEFTSKIFYAFDELVSQQSTKLKQKEISYWLGMVKQNDADYKTEEQLNLLTNDEMHTMFVNKFKFSFPRFNKIDLASYTGIPYPSYMSSNAIRTYMYVYECDTRNHEFNNEVGTTPSNNMLWIGGTHGGEVASEYTLYLMTKHLLNATMEDANLCKLGNAFNIYIVPILDVFGSIYRSDTTKLASNPCLGRVNANGVNINRNYAIKDWKKIGAFGDADYSGETPNSEFENQMISQLLKIVAFDVLLDLHGHIATEQVVYTELYQGETDKGQADSLFQALADISIALKTNTINGDALSRYYGNDNIVVHGHPAPNITTKNNNSGKTPTYGNEQGVPLSATLECPQVICFLDGIYNKAWHHHSDKVIFAIGEYMFMSQVYHFAEWVLNNK